MNFLSLNINRVVAVNRAPWVRNLKSKLKVDFIDLQETHQARLSDFDLRQFWGSSLMQSCVVDSVGRSGGLALIWNPDVFSLESSYSSQRFQLVSGKVRGSDGILNILNLHAPNNVSLRRSLWSEITVLVNNLSGSWVVFGDFNDVRAESERVNSRFDVGATDAFNAFINGAGLLEYPMTGGNFTFVSGHSEVKLSKLDRFLVNVEFMFWWPMAKAAVQERGASDHCPITLSCNIVDFGPIPFKFFNSWLGDQNVAKIVSNKIKEGIKKWRKEASLAKEKDLNLMKETVSRIESMAVQGQISDEDKKRRIDLRVKIQGLELAMAKNIQQKAHINWLKSGDENNSFFTRWCK
ncbi:uncharacterized protein LOC110895568 [Helianthus annuus]|uniref:uncharacterized protein LOC110895568 n=1 Tax=Helianthus annuus TaxID=4232 RepID=UPI000B8FF2C2|nr:uncharacterized protein LOC110895568 [Helianthus annuus]